MKKRKIKVVIYIRYSSHNQGGSFSTEYQLAECKRYLEECGYELVELEIAVQALQQALQSAITPEGVYSYLQELLTYHNSNEDELIKVLFDKLIDKIIVHDDRIEVHMVVFPFAHMGYNSPSAPPHVRLSTQATKKEIGCKIKG